MKVIIPKNSVEATVLETNGTPLPVKKKPIGIIGASNPFVDIDQVGSMVVDAMSQAQEEWSKAETEWQRKFLEDTIQLHFETSELERQLEEMLDEEELSVKNSGRDALVKLEKILAEIKSRFDTISARLNDLSIKRSQLLDQIIRSEDKLWRLSHDISENASAMAKVLVDLELGPKGSELRRLESKRQKLFTEQTALEENKARSETRLERHKTELEENERESSALTDEKAMLADSIKDCQRRIDEIRKDLVEADLPQVYVKRCAYGVIAAFRHFGEENRIEDVAKEIEAGRTWSDRITKFIARNDIDLPHTERVVAIKILSRIGRMRPSEYKIFFGNDTDVVEKVVRTFCKK